MHVCVKYVPKLTNLQHKIRSTFMSRKPQKRNVPLPGKINLNEITHTVYQLYKPLGIHDFILHKNI